MILLQILGPILVLDNEKKLFTASSAVLGAANIAGDLLNVYVFKGGAFGMGVATSIGYVIQLVLVFVFLFRKKTYFHVSRINCFFVYSSKEKCDTKPHTNKCKS